MNRLRSAAVVVVASMALALAGCSSPAGGEPGVVNNTNLPSATAGAETVKYHGTIAEGITVKGETQNSPTVTIASDAPKPTKLIRTDLVLGTGAVVKPGATVTVSYQGVEFNTKNVFNNTYDGGQTATFPLKQVIKGWEVGIPGMKVGGVRALVVPPEMAYGLNPPSGYPKGPLVFIVELQGIA